MPPPKKTASTSSQVHAILGTDDAKVKEMAMKTVQRLTPPGADEFANEIIEGNADNAEHAGQICSNVILALQTMPFFGGAKIVWLKGANFLGDNQTGKSQAAVQGFENILDVVEAGLGPEVQFVVSANSIDKRRTSYKRLGKLTTIEVFDKPDTSKAGWEGAVMAQAGHKARELGLSFESGALELLVQMAGDDTRQLENEIEKIDLYLGERRRCGIATVRGLVSLSRAGVIWEIGNAIGARDLQRSLELLGVLLYQGQNAIGILLGAIVPRVRSLLIVKELATKYKVNRNNYSGFTASLDALPSSATSHLPRKKDGTGFNAYPLFLALNEAGRFTLEELHAALVACLDANVKLVTTQLDNKVVLERLLVGLLTPRTARR
ncbi:DNA polymerase III delta subunit [Prosthecobacter fusiformis]|uniref:DNA polymerase III delta subunit n=1 Tax=Prosthecobacter fusiformis TaxID=48464 RepID=A0A4R7RL68_9BACT|nr:DNA polymerase III subunit delta [Prosthecobacter fusiformis]TDU64302.1 DNA polymerase III delta subunit [Prosthecobacter fusiformis]